MASINVISRRRAGALWTVEVLVGGETVTLNVRDDADLDRQILAREEAAARTITLGERDVAAPVVVVTPPTQGEIDRSAFVALVDDYRRMSAEVKAGVGKTAQSDLDAKVAEIKAAYKDEYAQLIVGVF